MLRLYEILKTSKTGIAPDLWTRLAAEKMAGDSEEVRELTGELPLTFTANGKPLIDYTIYGNMTQSKECGERTRNLFDKDNVVFSGFYPHADTGAVVNTTSGKLLSIIVPCEPNTSYTWSFDRIVADLRNRVAGYSTYPTVGMACTFLDRETDSPSGSTRTIQKFTTTANTHWLILMVTGTGQTAETLTEDVAENAQLEIGTEMTSYEPYGYKIPINSRGKNLFDKDNADVTHIYPLLDGTTFTQGGENTWSIIMPCKPNTTYVISKDILPGASGDRRHRVSGSDEYPAVGGAQTFVDDSSETISGDPRARQIFTTTADTHWIVCFLYYSASYETIIEQIQSIQIEEGNDKTEYEPYVQPTLSNIYLGNAQTTRYVKKLVLTGDENIKYDSQNVRFYFSLANSLIIGLRITPMFCSHYQCIDDGRPLADVPDNSIYSSDAKTGCWFIKDIDYTSAAGFKSFLTQQYANGTPVTVWYILATPETGIVNEPIRKIGNYADTISYEQAGVSIPTLNGQTVVDVDTTLKPSKMYIKYKE